MDTISSLSNPWPATMSPASDVLSFKIVPSTLPRKAMELSIKVQPLIAEAYATGTLANIVPAVAPVVPANKTSSATNATKTVTGNSTSNSTGNSTRNVTLPRRLLHDTSQAHANVGRGWPGGAGVGGNDGLHDGPGISRRAAGDMLQQFYWDSDKKRWVCVDTSEYDSASLSVTGETPAWTTLILRDHIRTQHPRSLQAAFPPPPPCISCLPFIPPPSFRQGWTRNIRPTWLFGLLRVLCVSPLQGSHSHRADLVGQSANGHGKPCFACMCSV